MYYTTRSSYRLIIFVSTKVFRVQYFYVVDETLFDIIQDIEPCSIILNLILDDFIYVFPLTVIDHFKSLNIIPHNVKHCSLIVDSTKVH